MQNDTDLLTPLPVDISTPNCLLYQLNYSDEKFLKSNEFYAFEMDNFTVPEMDDIPTGIGTLGPIQEEESCSLNVPPLEPLFPPVEPAPTGQHMLTEPEEGIATQKQLSCDLCAETFSSVQVLRLHRRVQHILTKEFRCRKCPASYNFESNLVLHMASHVPRCSKNIECPECKMVFKRISTFKGHLRSHETSDRFKCSRCEKEFDLKGYYEKHLAKAHKSGPDGTVEEILAKVAANARNRPKSKKPQGRYVCQKCGKSFLKPCLLRRHEIGHSSTKPFQCTECDQRFTQKTSLARHMLLHEGVKDFSCPKCSLSFAQKNNLITHIKRTHPMDANLDKMFACDYCACVFTKLNSLNRHKAMTHPEAGNTFGDDTFNDDDGDNVNFAKVMEQLKSLQESMVIMDMQSPELELSLMKPPSPGPKVRTITLVDTLNPTKKKTFQTVREIIHKDQKTLGCMSCDREFKRPFDLLRHLRTHTKEKLFNCEHCDKTFATSAGLKAHVNIHLEGEKIYGCAVPECGKLFSSIRKLDIHSRAHTSIVSYFCPVCLKTFSSKAGFSGHKHQTEDKEIDIVRPLLMQPVRIDSNEVEEAEKSEEYLKRSHQCYICGLKMQKLSHLRAHEATHQGDKPFKCTICLRSYGTQSSLNLHYKIHTAEKPYVCEVCNAKFITRSLLKRHMISHTDVRNFACPYCSERFKTSDNCKNHILTHARRLLASPEPALVEDDTQLLDIKDIPDEDPSQGLSQTCIAVVQSPNKNLSPKFIQLEMVQSCKKHNHKNLIVEKVANTSKKTPKKLLKRASNLNNKASHRCGVCGKVFTKASDLTRHARTHTKEKPFNCNLCERKFALRSTLMQHMKTHDTMRETYDCQVCGKKYKSRKVLVVHLRIHTGERPFHCGVCKKTFRTSGHKISHMKAHHKRKK